MKRGGAATPEGSRYWFKKVSVRFKQLAKTGPLTINIQKSWRNQTMSHPGSAQEMLARTID